VWKMAQIFWNIPNESGPDYEVGLYHGEKSGHVIVYSGTAILRIAFSVTASASYSFLLGDSLYLIKLTFDAEEWKYFLESVENGLQIPQSNLTRKEQPFPSDAIKITLIIFIVVLLLAGYFYFVIG
jgi:hypothetical protein